MPKYTNESTPESEKSTLGESPAVLAKRDTFKPKVWCPKLDIEYDARCDRDNPKAITYKEIAKAASVIKQEIPRTPLLRSRCCTRFDIELNYKLESLHRTGSFHERSALYSLLMLNEEQRRAGVITASTGNWATAVAYLGKRLGIPVTVVLPRSTSINFVDKCEDFDATVVVHGADMAESKRQAFVMISEGANYTYINGYDHPHIIAASGSIGIEILEQLPETEAILVPVGGGGLIAGIAVVIKQLKPDVLIYGIQSDRNCCFFKAMENEQPYQTMVGRSIASSLAVPTAGYNAFYTAKSLIDKMVLVNDDWLARAILHLVEEEKLVVDGAGAASLSPLMAIPNVLPELRGKHVVCVISGGNIDNTILPRCMERGKAIEGRLIKVTVTLPAHDSMLMLKILSIISNIGCNLLQFYKDKAWLEESNFNTIYMTFIIETRDLKHACTLKRVMEKLFPNMCEFLEEPFSPIPICACFPKKLP